MWGLSKSRDASQPGSMRRAASGGALAPEPPRASRSQPEPMQTVILSTTHFFFRFFWVEAAFVDFSGFRPNLGSAQIWHEFSFVWTKQKFHFFLFFGLAQPENVGNESVCLTVRMNSG